MVFKKILEKVSLKMVKTGQNSFEFKQKIWSLVFWTWTTFEEMLRNIKTT